MLKWKKIASIITVTLYLSAFFYPGSIFAQDQGSSSSTAAEQAQLQQQLAQIQAQIQADQAQLNQITGQKNTLQNKINQLKKQQAVLNLQIQSTNLQVTQLGSQITVTQNSIAQNTSKAEDLQNQVAGIMRSINQNDDYPFVYTAVSQGSLSDVFTAYEDYANVSQGLSGLIDQLTQTNNQLSEQQQQLSSQQDADQNLLAISTLQQSQLSDTVSQQNTLLQQTKGKEADYQIVVNDTKAQAAAIQARIYQLLGVSTQLTFGHAVTDAQWAQGVTGIDPAFLLAILTQESNLGQNVGTCNRPGDPPSKSYKVIMKPSRDIQPFLQITAALGLDPNVTPVSCPEHDKSGNQIGWGGAMGPAQFIPSTWVGYETKVAAITGAPANPWDIRDAFVASALKLVGGGADGTYQGEWDAAMRYFSGGTNLAYRFYGDDVMATTAKYKSDIAALKQ
jgi:peptidoglycan hydrolase CwlO-like protein